MTRLLALLLVDAQLADLALFSLAVQRVGIGAELGPLRVLYIAGGFGAVALAKLVALGAMLAILARLRQPRRWALLAATMGVAGAASGALAIV